ncbi:RING/U-box superfamily protein [Rhynchospora pubera]|uniref:RBR-type E3 ubiquitin transferase n=1 Tax=Rhynchospora pubera TaxID=906938 RepID=A0AAV8HCS5_9POAL|nr:RING/U-box superfamily protein [Rhynchospora pubera]
MTRIAIESPKLRAKRPRLERGEQSDTKTKTKTTGGRGDEGIIVIDSDDDEVFYMADDDVFSEEFQIQEILFMSMQPDKNKREASLPLKIEEEDEDQGPDIIEIDPIAIDRKGKRPATFSYSKPESGQSSRVSRSRILCKICMEQVRSSRIFTIKSCNHLFCISCIVHYIISKLDENISIIPCPDPGCKSGSLDPLTCQHILPSATFDKWGCILCESSLGHNKFYCPFKDCSALLVDEGDEELRNSECPHCNRMFCVRCKVPWHGDITCDEFQRLSKDERGREDLMLRKLAKDSKWQRCPQCRMYVEKIDGCMFMKCRCGNCFCYACATPMSKQTHYCIKCKR